MLPFAEVLEHELAFPPIQFLPSSPSWLGFIFYCNAPKLLPQYFDLLVDGDEVGTIIQVGFRPLRVAIATAEDGDGAIAREILQDGRWGVFLFQ